MELSCGILLWKCEKGASSLECEASCSMNSELGGHFGYFFVFVASIWGDDPIWPNFSRRVETCWNHQLVHTGKFTCWTQKLEVWKMTFLFKLRWFSGSSRSFSRVCPKVCFAFLPPQVFFQHFSPEWVWFCISLGLSRPDTVCRKVKKKSPQLHFPKIFHEGDLPSWWRPTARSYSDLDGQTPENRPGSKKATGIPTPTIFRGQKTVS